MRFITILVWLVAVPLHAQNQNRDQNCGLPCLMPAAPPPVRLKSAAEIKAEQLQLESIRAQNELMRAQSTAIQAETARQERQQRERERMATETPVAVSPPVDARQGVVLEEFRLRVSLARAKYKDFDEVTARNDIALTPAMQQAVMESDKSGDLMYYFGQHPDVCARIAALSPVRSILEIGKLSVKLEP